MELPQFFKAIANRLTAKKYEGIIGGGLPLNPKSWGKGDYLSALDISLYTNKAIAKRASQVGEIQFALHDAKGGVIEKDPVLDLLYKPNGMLTGPQFWALYQTYYDVIGEVYILMESSREIFDVKKVTGLHLLNPSAVTLKFKPDGTLDGYEYKGASKTTKYNPDQVIYVHNPDPKNPWRGQSLLRAGINAIETEVQIATYHARILANGGKVEGVFKFKTGNLTEDQLVQIKDRYKKEYAAASKSGIPLFLGGDSEYIKTGLSPNELAFLEAKKATFEDICVLTDVPRSMMANTSDTKFDNADAERATFLRETIRPLLRTLTVALDSALVPDNRTLTFIDPTPENVEEKRKNIETASTINAITTNEKRELLKGLGIELDPVDGGDEILVPFSVMPLGTDRSATPAASKSKSGELSHPLQDADVRQVYGKMMIKRMDAREKIFKKALDGYFEDQSKRIVEKLSPNKSRTFRHKALDEFLSVEVEVKIGKTLFVPILLDLLKQAGVDAMELGGSSYDFVLSDSIKSWMDNRTELFLREVNETTFKKLQDAFSDSLEQEEGREGLINRIEDTYDGFRGKRAPTIARTEVHNATQYGTMQGYKQAGLSIKIWVAVVDDHTRESHLSIDGEERPIDRPFSNGLMFPGDPSAGPEEVINCRCVI